mgnify:CR=1 FL=1
MYLQKVNSEFSLFIFTLNAINFYVELSSGKNNSKIKQEEVVYD